MSAHERLPQAGGVDHALLRASVPASGETHELLTLNIGPHHPATHGVLRLLVTLEGEVVRDIKPIIGYVHTGIEKTRRAEVLLEGDPGRRADGLPRPTTSTRWRSAAPSRRCSRCEVPQARPVPARDPPRAQPDHVAPRVARDERARPRRDLDVLVLLPRARDDPRPVRDVLRPADAHPLLPGRRRDGGHPARLRGEARAPSSPRCRTRADQYADLLEQNEILLQRLRGTCPLDEATLLALGVTGPLLRAAGNPWDLRKAAPYSSYDHFDFKIPVGTVGDNYDRFRVRHAEIYESMKIIEQAIDGLPEGPHITTDRKVALPAAPRAGDVDGGADPPLQARHRGLPRAAGRGLLPDRGARAASSAASCAPTAPPSPRACTCATRASSTSRPPRRWCKDAYIADLIATLAMLDPILGGIDR